MSLKGLQMKAMIVSDKNLFDVNDKLLEAGKYYFVIDSFGENKTVIGHIVSDHLKEVMVSLLIVFRKLYERATTGGLV